MDFSFLLRFQERCEDSSSGAVATGTETVTRILREQPDVDRPNGGFRSLPAAENKTGTVTVTRISSDPGDADHGSTAHTLPFRLVMGTTTTTAVKMEADDQDPRRHELTVLPRCSLY
jgi:hypothetical protein